jgi:hypothetical protein
LVGDDEIFFDPQHGRGLVPAPLLVVSERVALVALDNRRVEIERRPARRARSHDAVHHLRVDRRQRLERRTFVGDEGAARRSCSQLRFVVKCAKEVQQAVGRRNGPLQQAHQGRVVAKTRDILGALTAGG